MTLPTAPANLATGNTITEAWTDANRNYDIYYGEDRPGVLVITTMGNQDADPRLIFNSTNTPLNTSDSEDWTAYEVGYTTFWVAGNVNRLTVPVTGRWWVWMEVVIVGATSGGSRCGYDLNSSGSVTTITSQANWSGGNTILNGGREARLSASDTLDMHAWQNSGSTQSVGPSRWGMYLIGEQ